MCNPAPIDESLRAVLEPHVAHIKALVLQRDFVSARDVLLRALQLAQRNAGSSVHLELLKLAGLFCEMLGYRVEAGIFYCVGMRLTQERDPALASLFSRRLAHLAHPEKQRPLRPAKADDVQLQALGQFLHLRFDCLWEIAARRNLGPDKLLLLVQALGSLDTGSDVGQWIAEDLGYLATGISEDAFHEVLRAAPTYQWRHALIHARPQQPPT